MPTLQLAVFYFFGWASLLSLGFVLFRFPLKPYFVQIILSSLLLDYISVFLRSYDKIYLIATVQPICAILCYRLLFRIRLVPSIIITIVAYSINFALEFILNMALVKFNVSRFLVVIQDGTFAIAILILVIDVFLCYILSKYRIGFSFLSQHDKGRFLFKKQNKPFMYACLFALSFLLISSITIFYVQQYAFYFQLAVIFVWFVVLRLSYQKELAD